MQAICISLAWQQNVIRLPYERGLGVTASVLYTSLAWYGSPLVSITLAGTFLASAVQLDAIHSKVGLVLKHRWLAPLSNVSFALYLLHVQCMLAMALFCKPIIYLSSLGLSLVTQFASYVLITLIASYSASFALYFVVKNIV